MEQLGEAYGNSEASATLIGIGLQKCDQGADQVRVLRQGQMLCCHLLSERIQQEGSPPVQGTATDCAEQMTGQPTRRLR